MRILVTGALKKDDSFFAQLAGAGHSITYVEDERIPLKEQNIDPACFEGVICNGLFLYTPIEQFSNLRWIQLTSAGYDRVPMDYIHSRKIDICNAYNVYSIPMAEFILCGVLQLYKQSRFFEENQRHHRWEKHRKLLELYGKKVCIVGCGSVGTECAKRFRAFGCDVVGVNRTIRENPDFERIVLLSQMDEELPEADVVILSIALTRNTYHLISAQRLALMKPDAVLVNVARGGVIDTDALIKALPCLKGAVLDTFEDEPLREDSPLWGMENVIITPHNGFLSDWTTSRMQELIIRNLGMYTR